MSSGCSLSPTLRQAQCPKIGVRSMLTERLLSTLSLSKGTEAVEVSSMPFREVTEPVEVTNLRWFDSAILE